MIMVTRFDDSIVYINPHQIEFMEETPDLVISMLSGRKMVVREKYETVSARIIEYRNRIITEDSFNKPSFYGDEE